MERSTFLIQVCSPVERSCHHLVWVFRLWRGETTTAKLWEFKAVTFSGWTLSVEHFSIGFFEQKQRYTIWFFILHLVNRSYSGVFDSDSFLLYFLFSICRMKNGKSQAWWEWTYERSLTWAFVVRNSAKVPWRQRISFPWHFGWSEKSRSETKHHLGAHMFQWSIYDMKRRSRSLVKKP